jgi:hypothetical protein
MWDTFLAIGAVGLLFIGVFLLGRLVRARVRERIGCPERDREFSVVFERRLNGVWGLGQHSDVLQCTGFPDPTQVTCTKSCLLLAKTANFAPVWRRFLGQAK